MKMNNIDVFSFVQISPPVNIQKIQYGNIYIYNLCVMHDEEHFVKQISKPNVIKIDDERREKRS